MTKYSIQLDGREYNSIRRTENNAQGKNIFHTIDTLINAAIDNVKEEILLYVNISSKNSNQFVAAIGLGIPLNDVITIFTHPVIKELSKYRSFELDSNISIEGLKDKVRISKFRSSTGVSIDSLKKSIRKESQLSEEEIHALLGLYYNLTQIGDAIFDATNALSVLNKLPGTPQEISRVMAS